MATRNKRKLAALNKQNCEEHPRSNLAQNSNVPRSQEDYITQVSEEIEGWVTKKLSREFSRTENRILGALARLDDFLMNPLIQGHSGTAPGTSRNVFSINQGTNEDDSQSDPLPEAGLFNNEMTQNSGPEDGHDMVTGAAETGKRDFIMDHSENAVLDLHSCLYCSRTFRIEQCYRCVACDQFETDKKTSVDYICCWHVSPPCISFKIMT